MKTIVDQVLTIYDMLLAEPAGVSTETLRSHAGPDYDQAITILMRAGLVAVEGERAVTATAFRP